MRLNELTTGQYDALTVRRIASTGDYVIELLWTEERGRRQECWGYFDDEFAAWAFVHKARARGTR